MILIKPQDQNAASFPAKVFSDSPKRRGKNLPERAKPKTRHLLGKRPIVIFIFHFFFFF